MKTSHQGILNTAALHLPKLSRRQRIAAAVALSLGVASAAYAAVTIPNTFVAGAAITAAQMNANFAALKTALETATGINAGAITASQLNVAGTAANGKVLKSEAGGLAWGDAFPAFVHQTTAANVNTNWSCIDHPSTNAKPGVLVFITHNYNPSGVGGAYLSPTTSTGVFYRTVESRWCVFYQDTTQPMPVNRAFNVMVASP